jgi:Ca2+-binding RTX toxin-like protein
MAWQVPLSTSQVTTVAALGETDSALIMRGVAIASTGDTTIRGFGSNHEVIVDGAVTGVYDTIWLGADPSNDSNNKVTVSEGAYVRSVGSASDSGIASWGTKAEIVNHGTVSSSGFAVILTGVSASTASTVINTGLIDGGTIGVARVGGGTETIILNNSGTISGGTASYGEYNQQAVAGKDLIANSGRMIGDILLGGGDDLYDGRLGTVDGDVFGQAGTDRLYSGAGNNRLFGGDGNDTLMGGAGADYLSGGLGSDRAAYTTSKAGITVSLANASLNTGDAKGDTFNSVENLTGSDFSDTLYGTNGVNVISGGAGNDTIKGYRGNDTLAGGSGKDQFVFASALSGTSNVDTITDFRAVDDTIRLDNAYFASLTTLGTLSAAAFRANTTGLAQDSSDRIIYETDTGELYYDANGNAAGGAVLFAKVGPGLGITNADFVVI